MALCGYSFFMRLAVYAASRFSFLGCVSSNVKRPHDNQYQRPFLFCTNTIIEGVNTSAKNVIYYDNRIGSKNVDYFDYLNIRDRARRPMEHDVGKIINLKKPPEVEKTGIDFPFLNRILYLQKS